MRESLDRRLDHQHFSSGAADPAPAPTHLLLERLQQVPVALGRPLGAARQEGPHQRLQLVERVTGAAGQADQGEALGDGEDLGVGAVGGVGGRRWRLGRWRWRSWRVCRMCCGDEDWLLLQKSTPPKTRT